MHDNEPADINELPAARHSHPSRHMLRRIGALLAGILANVIPSLVTDIVMYAAGAFPAPGKPTTDAHWPFLLATIYRTVYGVAGSCITARLAPDRPMQHALALGILGFVVSTIGAVVTWNAEPSLGPRWYPLALVALALPTAWAGGKLGISRRPVPGNAQQTADRCRSPRA